MAGNGSVGCLGLYPAFDPQAIGGIQAVSRICWDVVANSCRKEGSKSALFLYGAQSETRPEPDLVFRAGTRIGSLWAGGRLPRRPERLIVGHLGLLPVAWFSRPRSCFTWLYGIEAWRRQSLVSRWLMPRTGRFLTISDHTWTRFVEVHPECRSQAHQTVLLGLEAPIGRPTTAPESEAVLMISRLSRSEDYKGHREVLSAWPSVRKARPSAQLWVVGEGDLKPDLQRLAADLELGEAVRFFGQVSELEKQRLIEDSRCLAMPSRGEGFGLVYLEAMRLGRPCLVSDCDAGREVVNPPEAGLAVDPGNRDHLSEALVRLLNPSPEWERWSEQARARYEGNFTEAHFRRRFAEAIGLGLFTTENTEDTKKEQSSANSAISVVNSSR